ncbi:hypothetical protein HND97_15880 [Vibrio cholerae]|nr:hypothetical protein HND97_15880 [Vibrio cholerae]
MVHWKTIIDVKDLNGNLLGYEEAYSAQGYDLGQEDFNPMVPSVGALPR